MVLRRRYVLTVALVVSCCVRLVAAPRALLIHPDEFTDKWIARAKGLGVKTLAIHPVGGGTAEASLKDLLALCRTTDFRARVDRAKAAGVNVEYELHAGSWLVPRELFAEHPDYFRMDPTGVRTQLFNFCVSSPGALAVASRRAGELAKGLYRSSHRYYFWLDDSGNSSCHCSECSRLSPSDQQLVALNAMLRGLKSVDPEAKLAYLAYIDTLKAPTAVRPEPGIFLEYAPIHRAHDRPIGEQGGTRAADITRLLDCFGRDGSRVLEYWFDNSLFSNWTKPEKRFVPHTDVIKADLAWYGSLGFAEFASFACYLGPNYERQWGEPDLSAFRAGRAGLSTFRVRDYGAKGDGVTVDTKAVQAAVDAAAQAGGGTVELDAGTYVTGSVFLKSNVDFHVGPGATLKGSGNRADYNAAEVCVQNEAWAGENSSGAHLLLCIEQTNVVVRGEGTIDGNGAHFTVDPKTGREWPMGTIPWRPSQMLFFVESRNVRVEGLRLVNSPYWTCFFHGCDYVVARGLEVKTSRAPRTFNGDGIDVDCCQFVRISDCVIETDDDSITLRANPKKLKRKQDCAYVTVENCVLSSVCNAVRLGVGEGTVRDAVFSNLVIRDTKTAIHFAPGYSRGHGTDIRNCRFSNLQVDCLRFCVANHQFSHAADIRDIFFNGASGVQKDRSILWAVPEKPFGLFSFVDVTVNGGLEAVNAPNVRIAGGSFALNKLTKEEYDKLSDDLAHERKLLW